MDVASSNDQFDTRGTVFLMKKWCELSLTAGLFSWGSIPLHIVGLGGFLALVGLSTVKLASAHLHEQWRKEAPMTDKRRSVCWFGIKMAMTSTAWTVGTGMWVGALSG